LKVEDRDKHKRVRFLELADWLTKQVPSKKNTSRPALRMLEFENIDGCALGGGFGFGGGVQKCEGQNGLLDHLQAKMHV